MGFRQFVTWEAEVGRTLAEKLKLQIKPFPVRTRTVGAVESYPVQAGTAAFCANVGSPNFGVHHRAWLVGGW